MSSQYEDTESDGDSDPSGDRVCNFETGFPPKVLTAEEYGAPPLPRPLCQSVEQEPDAGVAKMLNALLQDTAERIPCPAGEKVAPSP